MKKLFGGLGVAFIAVLLMAQTNLPNSVGFGGSPSTSFATSISQCPTLTNGYFVCVVVPAGAQPFLALSVGGFNNGAPFQVVTQQTPPPPPTSFSCPTVTESTTSGISATGCSFK